MFRDFLDAAAAEYRPEKQAWIFYGLAASAVKRANGLSLEEIALVLHRLPFVRIGRCRLAFDDRLPEFCELRVQAREWLLIIGNVVLRENRFDRALGNAERAIDAFVRIDDQKVGTLPKAVDRADIDAVGILATDATLGDNIGHCPESLAGAK